MAPVEQRPASLTFTAGSHRQFALHRNAMSDLDAIIIGAGHNGLTCAAYLGMAGLRVRVLERRGVVGGAFLTGEFHPGLPNSTPAYTGGLFQPKGLPPPQPHQDGLRHAPP